MKNTLNSNNPFVNFDTFGQIGLFDFNPNFLSLSPGDSFDYETMDLKPSPFNITTENKRTSDFYIDNFQMNFFFSDDEQSLDKILDIKLSSKLMFINSNIGATLFAQQVSTKNSRSLNLYISGNYLRKKITMLPRRSDLNYIPTENIQTFRNTYGTHYVNQVLEGGYYIIKMILNTSSSTLTNLLHTTVHADTNQLTFSGNLDIAFRNLVKESHKSGELELLLSSQGLDESGQFAADLTELSAAPTNDLFQGLARIIRERTRNEILKPIPVGYRFGNLIDIEGMQLIQIPVLEPNEQLKKMYTKYEEVTETKNKIDQVLLDEEKNLLTFIEDLHKTKVNELQGLINQDRETLITQMKNCYKKNIETSDECKIPNLNSDSDEFKLGMKIVNAYYTAYTPISYETHFEDIVRNDKNNFIDFSLPENINLINTPIEIIIEFAVGGNDSFPVDVPVNVVNIRVLFKNDQQDYQITKDENYQVNSNKSIIKLDSPYQEFPIKYLIQNPNIKWSRNNSVTLRLEDSYITNPANEPQRHARVTTRRIKLTINILEKDKYINNHL